MKTDEMIGKKFGKLLVLERAPKNPNLKSRCKRYKCLCDCGQIIEVNGNSLRTGHTTSCGCSRKTSAPYVDLTNKRFGKLVALYIIGSNDNRRKMWHCKCDCGKEIDVSSHELQQGHTKSCGCIKSYKELEIKSYLEQKQIPFNKEQSFNDLYGKERPLRFDFAILKNDKIVCLIEYQGDQHYNINNKWHTSDLIENDKKKKEYCQINNIPLYYLNKDSDIIKELERISKLYGY